MLILHQCFLLCSFPYATAWFSFVENANAAKQHCRFSSVFCGLLRYTAPHRRFFSRLSKNSQLRPPHTPPPAALCPRTGRFGGSRGPAGPRRGGRKASSLDERPITESVRLPQARSPIRFAIHFSILKNQNGQNTLSAAERSTKHLCLCRRDSIAVRTPFLITAWHLRLHLYKRNCWYQSFADLLMLFFVQLADRTFRRAKRSPLFAPTGFFAISCSAIGSLYTKNGVSHFGKRRFTCRCNFITDRSKRQNPAGSSAQGE